MYVREGLGKAWYETALDIASQAGSAVVGSVYGPGAAEAVQSLHKGWTGLVFGNKNQPSQPAATPQAPSPAPRPSAPPPAPTPSRAPRPAPPPSYGGRITTMALPPEAGHGGTNWLLIGGLGLGAVVLYLAFKKPHSAAAVPR